MSSSRRVCGLGGNDAKSEVYEVGVAVCLDIALRPWQYAWRPSFSCTLKKDFFSSCGNLLNLLAHVGKIRVSIARLSIGVFRPWHHPHLKSIKREKKKRISYPSFESQCQPDTENEFVSTQIQPEWVSYAVARVTGRSWNRRVQIVEVRGSGRHRADKEEGSPFELTNVDLEGQVRWWNRLDLSASAAGRMRLRRLECRRILTQPVDQTLSPQDWQGGGERRKKKGREKGMKKRRREVQGGGFWLSLSRRVWEGERRKRKRLRSWDGDTQLGCMVIHETKWRLNIWRLAYSVQ